MATLGLNLTGLSSGYPIPGSYVEVLFAQGASAGDLSAKKVLMLAPSTSGGDIVQDTEVYGPVSDETEAITKLGAGSPAHRMVRAFLAVNKTAQVYVVAPTRSAGVAATIAVLYATTTTGAGTTAIEICEETVEVAFISGETATDVALRMSNAINALTHLPVLAVPTVGSIAITAKVAGPEGNAIRLRARITSGVAMTVTQTTEAPLASGATAASLTNALATIAALDFDVIVPHTHTGTSTDAQLSALATQVNAQALPITGIRQKVLAGTALAPATAVTLAQGINKPRVDLINLEESPLEPSVVAAICAGVAANTYFVDPASNLDGYGTKAEHVFPVKPPRNQASNFTATEQTLMLNGGVTPVAVSAVGTPYIVRAITTYSLNGATADYRVRDTHRVYVADWYADTALVRLGTTPWTKLTDDPPNDLQPPANFATPKRVKSLIEQLISDGVAEGYLDPSKKQVMLDSLSVGIDPLNATRNNIGSNVFSANLYHQSAHLVRETSAAA